MAPGRRPRRQHGAGCPRHRAAVGHRRITGRDLDLCRSARHSVLCRGHAAANARPADQKAADHQHPRHRYIATNRWQQLQITDLPRMLAGQVRILRSQLAMNVDGREAYISRVLLNLYGGPGVTNVWTDDLEVFGHVPSVMNVSAPGAGTAVSGSSSRTTAARCRAPAARKSNWPARSCMSTSIRSSLAASNIAASGWPSSSSWASTPSGCAKCHRRPFSPKPGSLACGWSVRRRRMG